MEQTFVMVKPDGVQRNLIGEIISTLEQKGYKLVALKMLQIDEKKAEQHYAEHKGKPFYEGLVGYITSSPAVVMVWEGEGAVSGVRAIIGATDPAKAAPGTIRGDYAQEIGRNVVHGADSQESAAREMAIYFAESEFCSYEKCDQGWIYE